MSHSAKWLVPNGCVYVHARANVRGSETAREVGMSITEECACQHFSSCMLFRTGLVRQHCNPHICSLCRVGFAWAALAFGGALWGFAYAVHTWPQILMLKESGGAA